MRGKSANIFGTPIRRLRTEQVVYDSRQQRRLADARIALDDQKSAGTFGDEFQQLQLFGHPPNQVFGTLLQQLPRCGTRALWRGDVDFLGAGLDDGAQSLGHIGSPAMVGHGVVEKIRPALDAVEEENFAELARTVASGID